jgi:hypothetical protein
MIAITTNSSISVNAGFRHRPAVRERTMANPRVEMEDRNVTKRNGRNRP